jgi:AcrR family transcriptional regulator
MARKRGGEMDTRAALVEAALELFIHRGYEATSVDAVAAKAGLSKGTFFHFFSTKRAILEEVCNHVAEEGFGRLLPLLDKPGAKASERIAAFLDGARRWKAEQAVSLEAVWTAVNREENAALRVRLDEMRRSLAVPRLAGVLAEGHAAGELVAPEPEVAARLVVALVQAGSEHAMERLVADPGEATCRQVRRELNATVEAIERLLGLPHETIGRIRPGVIRAFARALAGARKRREP